MAKTAPVSQYRWIPYSEMTAEDLSELAAYPRVLQKLLHIRGITTRREAEVFLTLDEPAVRSVSAGMFGESAEVGYPGVRGIAVVCTGGNLPRVRAAVTELLSAALAVPTSRVRVAGK